MRRVGYRQAWQALESGDLAPLRERGIAATRQLAKRQLTWLRGMRRIPIAADAPDVADRMLAAARAALASAARHRPERAHGTRVPDHAPVPDSR